MLCEKNVIGFRGWLCNGAFYLPLFLQNGKGHAI